MEDNENYYVTEDGILVHNGYAAGSPEHKAARWEEYQANGGKWDYDRWSNVYDANMLNAKRGNAAADAYRDQLGWGKREVTVDVNGTPRRLDIADIDDMRGVEVKSGDYFSRTEEIRSEIARDKQLVEQGWDIEWRIEGGASQPLLDELKEAGIKVTHIK
ncbi:hypothetical protein H5J24_10465 [Chryseobacterium capnotolerans]|nr:hypothetical protein H5J24_10465 [Chryseobacterium capnotolerans]